MSLSRWAKPLDIVLRALSNSETMVPDERDRTILSDAAIVVKELRQISVVIVTGPDHDPVVNAVDDIGETVDAMRDDLAVIGDHVDDLRRQLRKAATTDRGQQ